MTTITRDRATAAQERNRILRSRDRFWRPDDLATSGSTTLHLLADLVEAGELRRIRRGLYWRGIKSPLGMSYPRTETLVSELAPGPGVGPAGLHASNALRLSTQVTRRAEIAVPYRAPRDEGAIRFWARPSRTGRRSAGLNATEVAFLEVLSSWESVIELPPAEARERLLELLASDAIRADRLALAAATEPASVRARLRELLHAHGRADLAERIPLPDPRTAAAATRVLEAVS